MGSQQIYSDESNNQELYSQSLQSSEFEMEKILDVRQNGITTEYLVKWLGYDDSENTWEPQPNVIFTYNFESLLQEYQNKLIDSHYISDTELISNAEEDTTQKKKRLIKKNQTKQLKKEQQTKKEPQKPQQNLVSHKQPIIDKQSNIISKKIKLTDNTYTINQHLKINNDSNENNDNITCQTSDSKLKKKNPHKQQKRKQQLQQLVYNWPQHQNEDRLEEADEGSLQKGDLIKEFELYSGTNVNDMVFKFSWMQRDSGIQPLDSYHSYIIFKKYAPMQLIKFLEIQAQILPLQIIDQQQK